MIRDDTNHGEEDKLMAKRMTLLFFKKRKQIEFINEITG